MVSRKIHRASLTLNTSHEHFVDITASLESTACLFQPVKAARFVIRLYGKAPKRPFPRPKSIPVHPFQARTSAE